jgi:CheY-like chemotaxis protein
MLRIALVEDNPAEAHLLERALHAGGTPVELVRLEDGAQAIEYLNGSSSDCDLVLLDLNLPRLSGFDVLERLRSQDRFKGLPIVVVSGSADPSDVERCYRAGANSYVCKPIHVDEMFAMAVQLVDYWSRCVTIPPRRSEYLTRLAG